MALIPKFKKRKNSVRSERSSTRRIELKNSAKRSAIKKNLRRQPRVQAKKSGSLGKFWLKLRAPALALSAIVLGLLVFIVIGVGLLFSYNFFTANQYFAVKTIEIEGHNRLKSREVLETAGLFYGQNSLAISIDQMERSLASNPWVAELSVRRVLPAGIEIKIREHEPYYWVKLDGQLNYADEYGAIIAPVQAGSFASYPLLELESGVEFLAERLPDLVGSLERLDFPIRVQTASSVRLSAAQSLEVSLDNGLRLIVGLDGWDSNLKNLVRVLDDLSRRSELKKVAEIKAFGKGVWVGLKRNRA